MSDSGAQCTPYTSRPTAMPAAWASMPRTNWRQPPAIMLSMPISVSISTLGRALKAMASIHTPPRK